MGLNIPAGSPWVEQALGTYGPFTLTVRCGRATNQACAGGNFPRSSDFVEICARSSVDWIANKSVPHTPAQTGLLQEGSRDTDPARPPFWISLQEQNQRIFEPLLTRDPNFPDYVAVAGEAAGLSVQGYDCVISGSIVHLPGPTQ